MYRQSNVADNLKKYRKLKGLTQSELAKQLYVTAQNVSKWETGKSVPDLENLCKISEVFGVSPDRLLKNEDRGQGMRMLVAIDGGGTKTEFILCTEKGEIRKRLVLTGSNSNIVGMEKAEAVLKKGMDQLLAFEPNITAVYAGIAGCGLKATQKKYKSFFKKTYPMLQSKVASDVTNVIYSASVKETCIAVICGTGSVIYAKTKDDMHRVGGWGWLWESGCSGYDFGRDLLHAALSDEERMGPATCLTAMTQARFNGSVMENLGEIYRLGQDGIAALAPMVFEAYSLGDTVAKEIVEKNARLLARQINIAAERYDCGNEIVMAGGMTHFQSILEQVLKDKLAPGLRLYFSDKPQICGAAVGGCRMLGNYDESFKNNFYENYMKFLEETHHAENGNA